MCQLAIILLLQDCSPESIKAFKCATMMPTAPDAWVFSRYNCSEPKKRFFPSELYFLLCLSRVNTPYLGHFYEKKSVVRGLSEFGDLMRSGGKQTRFVGSDQQQNIKQLNTLQTSTVTYGGGIKLINFQGKDGGFLSLPGEIIPGTCGPSVPIQYLLDSNSLCSVVITQSSCTKDPKLQPSFYLTSLDANLFSSADNITNDNETTESPTVDTQTTPKISVKYLCYQSEILSECSSVSLGAPTYNTARKMCEKAVMEVKYDLYWNASRITNVNAEIIIGDLMEAPTFMRFSVRFYHHEKLLSPVENASLPKRSGNPGYDVGRPLIAVRKNLDGKMSYSDVNQLQSWRPGWFRHNSFQLLIRGWCEFVFSGANGLCESAKLNRLNFLEDVDSTCYLPLTQWDFNNCTNLWWDY